MLTPRSGPRRLPLCLLFALISASTAWSQAPVPEFSGTPTSGAAPLAVSFTDATTGTVTAWSWTFGDAGTSTAQNPNHTYTAVGTYTVALTSTGPGGSATNTKTSYISVTDPAPVADFSGTPTTGTAPLAVTFTDATTGNVSSWSWSFGDAATSTLQNPAHTYTGAGTYTVTLTSTGPGGSDPEAKANYITVNEPPPVANFSGTPTTGVAPLSVTFTDSTTGAASAWSWNFGDAGTSILQNPAHTYAGAGTYTVTLTSTGPGGSDGETKLNYITVSEPPPVANFSGTPTTGVAPLTVGFTDSSTGAVTGWSWAFGDATTSLLQNPSHTYSAAGTYTVTLTATGPGGSDGDTKLNYITVSEPPPVADFSGTPLSGAAPLSVAFTDATTGAVSGWSWNFGDTNTSIAQNPSHTYAAVGTYTVTLTSTGPGGADGETKLNYIIVSEPPPVAGFTGSPLTGPAPLTVNFTDATTGNVSAWSWNFGDTNTSIVQNTSNTYTAVGTYSVILTSTGPGGSDSETKVNYVTVTEPAPVANFTGTPTTGAAPLSVSFTDTSTNTVTAWSWAFGDAGTSTLQNPSHTYAAVGTYTVTLTATGPGGSDGDTKLNYITVNEPPPVADFTGTPTTGVLPLTVMFADATTGMVTAWSWNFGDANTSIAQNPTHTYANAGTYTVALTATGPGGPDTNTKLNYITVSELPPVAGFSGTPTTGILPLTVNFTDMTSGVVTGWSWSFGDATTSMLQNPSHTYATAGTYNVSLTSTGSGGSDTDTKIGYITVSEPAPVADFTGTPTTGDAPLTVAFNDVSSGAVTSWAWNFGDAGTSTLQNPSHTYTAVGTYTVTLTATGPGGSDGNTKLNYITANEPAPAAEFTGSPTSGVAPLTVNFTDATTNMVTSWLWSFGDGGMSTLQNPSNTFTTVGTYTVSLTATGPGGVDTQTKPGYITVGNAPPVAQFTGSPLSGSFPLNVTFTDQSTGVVTGWSWTFGDGGTSLLQNPTHTYNSAGTFAVALTATGPGGSDTNTKLAYVMVTDPPPVANFTGTPTSGIAPLAVNFADATTGNVTAWSWTFGDGSTSMLQNPNHTYTTDGTYTVTLTSTGPGGGNTNTKTDYITVAIALPVAEFSGTPTSGGSPLNVAFTDLSAGAVTSWSWTFGDASSSSLQNPTHTYTALGTYAVSLSATNSSGSDLETKLGYISVTDNPPIAAFSGVPVSGVTPLNVLFTDFSMGTVTNWAWSFGDGGTSTAQNPAYTYSTAGTYAVSLTVSNGGGSDTDTKLNYITVTQGPPAAAFSASTTSGPAPLAVSFTDMTTGLVSNWSWDFGDLGTSNLQNPSNAYTDPGTYTVTLTAMGPGGIDSEIKHNYISVTETPPDAEFLGAPSSGVAPLTVAFTDMTAGTVTAWSWAFGDSGVSAQQSPVHTYSLPGTYTVTLTSSGPGGSDSVAKANYITVGEPVPVAEFIGVPLTGVAPVTVSFTDQSVGNITAWSWNFGDLNTTTQQNPANTYATAGTYTVSLNVTGPGGVDNETKADYIVITEPAPNANFAGTPLTGQAPHTVNFTDLSSGAVTAWSWNFGDLGTSTAMNASHTYTDAGTYSITLTAIGPGGTDSRTRPNYVTVTEAPPVAEFSGSPTEGVDPLSVVFTDFSTGTITSWLWNFGDASTSTGQEPTHVYTVVGTYTVSLTVTGPAGSDGETKVDYISVVEPPPTAEFFGSPLAGIGPLSVSFLDQSTGGITSWSWDFGDLGASTVQHPIHTYTSAGTFTVRLTVQGLGGIDTETKTNYVTVGEPPPTAEFSGAPLNGSAPLSVSFTDFSSGTTTSWSWAFGDGGSSSQQHPTHIYNTPGAYAVSLTVTSSGGADTETKLNYISVLPAIPAANFVASATVGAAPMNVSFTDLSTGSITSWAWDFGDLGTSSLQNPTHAYLGAGTYTVTLTIKGPGGIDTDMKTDYITVADAPPAADFAGAPVSGTIPLTVNFTDLSTGVVTGWLWTFGDGGTSFLQNPSRTYSIAGTYTVTLTATGPGGPHVETKVDYVTASDQPPIAGFIGSPISGMAPLAVSFTDQTAGLVTSWSWDFGDLETSALQNPVHTYAAEGSYSVTLTATGPGGSDDETRSGYIIVGEQAPQAEFLGTPLAGVAPLTVSFSDQSTGTITGWSWNFGDLTTSIQQDPTHIYSDPGTFTVSLTVVGPGGATTETKPNYVTVGAPSPAAEFSGAPRAGGSPLTVFFTDFSTGNVTSWNWTFGDGNSSNQQNPAHIYTMAGNYTVSLTVTSPGGGDTETKLGYVTVGDAQPVAAYSATPLSGFAPLTVTFTDASMGGVSTWLWDFGDLGTSTLQDPVHIFQTQGTYTVSLTVMNGIGIDSEVKVDYVAVTEPPPNAIFTAAPRNGAAPLAVSFSDESSGNITTWAWNFGDGGMSNLENPMYIYTIAGTYTVSLQVNSLGGVDSQVRVDYITISPPTIEDPSFEQQIAGTAPAFPWSITNGLDHVIQPDGVAVDNGMPADLDNWADLSALGTTASLPPSNPGGVGSLPVGAAGIQQDFNYDPTRSVLIFDTAFLRSEPGMAAASNDFMSVDVSDGVTSYNLYYADTFSTFPNVSARYGLPMTDIAHTQADMTDLYPAADTNTVLTLYIQVGNGGDGNDPSRGYIDRIALSSYATASLRNGLGVNPLFYVAPPPVIGSLWSGQIDTEGHPGAGFTFIFFYSDPFEGFIVPNSGEILYNPASTFYLATAVPANGGITLHNLMLPNSLNFVGLPVSSQGYITGGGYKEYTNAVDMSANVAANGQPPAASFTVSTNMGTVPLPVSFTDTSTGVFSEWNWDFGDGNISILQNPAHVYTTPGTYTISLHIIGPGGFDVTHQYNAVVVQ